MYIKRKVNKSEIVANANKVWLHTKHSTRSNQQADNNN